MNKILTSMMLCFLFLGANKIVAQPSLFIDPDFQLVNEGDVVTISFSTENFTDIEAFRFAVEYDTDVLQYVDAPASYTFNPTLDATGGCSVTSDGNRLIVECDLDPSCNPMSLPCDCGSVVLADNDFIVDIDFTALNGYTNLEVISDPLDADNIYFQRICQQIGVDVLDEPAQVFIDNPPISINIPDANVNEGEQFCMDFTVSDFEDIVSMQYTIGWDQNVLSFESATGFNLPGLGGLGQNIFYDSSTETLLLTWNDPPTTGVTVPDGTGFMQVCFDVTGTCGQSTSIELLSVPTPVEVTNVDDPGQDIGYLDGIGLVTVNCNNADGLGINVVAPQNCVNPGESFEVCTEISNFSNLEEVDFTINWNASAISATDANITFPSSLGGFGLGQLNTSQMSQGQLGISWSDCNGQSVPDGESLLCIEFTSVGEGGVNSSISITSDLSEINVTDDCGSNNNLGVNSQNALVEICIPDGITLIAGNLDADPGELVCVPITVQDFNNIGELGFSLAWDNNILSFNSVQSIALPGLTTNVLSQFGSLCAEWSSNSFESLPDGTVLFEVCFDAIGAAFTCSPISFTQVPCEQTLITDESNGFSVDINAQDGEVCMVNPLALNVDISNANGLPGQTVCVDFSVSNFVSLSEVAFSVEWDASVLEYVSLNNANNLPNFTTDSYSDNNAQNGALSVNWESLSSFGNSLSNQTTIFSLCFEPIGGSGECSDIDITATFVDNQEILAISAFGGQNLGLGFTQGEICIDNFVILDQAFATEPACVGEPTGAINITLQGGSGDFNVVWLDSDGNTVSTGSTADNTEDLTGAESGDYTLIVTDNLNPTLVAEFQLSIGVSDAAPVADAGDDFFIPCDGNGFGMLDGSGSDTGINYTYEWYSTDPMNSNVNPPNVLNPQVFGAGEFVLAVTDTTTGCTITDTVTVFPIVFPSAVLSFADQDSVLNCLVDTVQLSSLESSNFANTNIQYTWSSNDGQVDAADVNAENIAVTVPGEYVLEVLNLESGCSSTDTILVEENVVIPLADAGNDANLTCAAASIDLDCGNSDSGPDIVYAWTDINGNNLSNDCILASVTVEGDYILFVTNEENGCVGSDTVSITADNDVPDVAFVNTVLSIDCNNPEVTIDATGSSTGADFDIVWAGPSNPVNQLSDLEVLASEPGIYTLTITNTSNGCVQSAGVDVADSTAVPFIGQLVADTISCVDLTSVLDAGNSDMGDHFTYQWTGPEVAAGTENLFIAEATTYGDYTFTITNTNTGCTNDGLVSVFADTLVSLIQEIVPVGASDDFEITCNPNDIVISAQLILDGSDYDIIWSGPCIDASTDTNPVFNCAGTSTVMYTNNQNGCMASQTVEVTENTTAPNIASVVADVTEWDCITTTATVTVNLGPPSVPGDFVINWQEGGCNFSVIDPSAPSTQVTGPCTYNVLVTDETNGCTDNGSVEIIDIIELPEAVDAGPSTVNINCDPAEVDLNGSSDTPGVEYLWTGPSGFSASTASTTVTETGVYTLVVTNPVNNCFDSDVITVEDSIAPDVSAGTNVEFDCLDTEVTIDGFSNSNVSYSWDGDCLVSDNTASVTVTCPGTYTLTVTDLITGCSAEDSMEVISVIGLDLADASSSGDPCLDELDLSGNIPAIGVTGQWTSSSSDVVFADPTLPEINVAALPEGTYDFTWTLSTPNCPDYSSSTVEFTVLGAPEAFNDEMEIDDDNPLGVVDLAANDNINAGSNYVVTVGDVPPSGEFVLSESTVQYTPGELVFEGMFDVIYNICLEDCPDLCSTANLSIIIDREIDADADFPNAITPNGDGVNDVFVFDILSANAAEYEENEMIIFNRWGDIVYSAAPYTNSWSGQTDSGDDLPEGTYYYVLKLDVAKGLILKGSVTVLR